MNDWLDDVRRVVAPIIRSGISDRDSQDDLIQDVLVEVYRAYKEGRVDEDVEHYAKRAARNRCIDHYRKLNSRYADFASADYSKLIPRQGFTDDRFELRALINLAQEQMSEDEQKVIVLLAKGHTYKQIAKVLGISWSGVKTKYWRIRQRLRKHFEATK